jgi:hypothetical protein
MTPLINLFLEQLFPSLLVWVCVYLALKFRGKARLNLLQIILYVILISLLSAITRLLFGLGSGSNQEAAINALVLPLLFSLGIAVFAVNKSSQ